VENKQAQSPVSTASCQTNDLTCRGMELFLWCLPIIAVVVGSSWAGDVIVAFPAFLVMGSSCLANAARCGRVHCTLLARCSCSGPSMSRSPSFIPLRCVQVFSWALCSA